MAIPMAVILGLACTFYVYAVIQWAHEAMMIREEGKRSLSAMVRLFVSSPGDVVASSARGGNRAYAGDNATAQAAYGSRDVIVMNRAKTRKQDKRVVA